VKFVTESYYTDENKGCVWAWPYREKAHCDISHWTDVLHLVITTCYESSAQCTLFIFHVWSLQQAVHHA